MTTKKIAISRFDSPFALTLKAMKYMVKLSEGDDICDWDAPYQIEAAGRDNTLDRSGHCLIRTIEELGSDIGIGSPIDIIEIPADMNWGIAIWEGREVVIDLDRLWCWGRKTF